MNSPSATSRSSLSTARVPSPKTFETRFEHDASHGYSFTAPPTRPRTSARCESRNTIATGTTASSVASASSGRKMLTDWPPPPAAGLNDGVEESRFESPTVIGYWFESARTTYGRKKLFQSATKLKKKTSATIGFASGSATRRNVCSSPAPSARAASSRLGRERRQVVDVGEVDAEREERERQDHRRRTPDQMQAVQLEEDREHECGRRHDHRDERQREDELAAGELPEREAVPRGHADDERDRGCAERVIERVGDPVPVDVVAERVEVLPGERDLMEAAERERAARDERVVALRRREDQPEDRAR